MYVILLLDRHTLRAHQSARFETVVFNSIKRKTMGFWPRTCILIAHQTTTKPRRSNDAALNSCSLSRTSSRSLYLAGNQKSIRRDAIKKLCKRSPCFCARHFFYRDRCKIECFSAIKAKCVKRKWRKRRVANEAAVKVVCCCVIICGKYRGVQTFMPHFRDCQKFYMRYSLVYFFLRTIVKHYMV